MDKGEFKSLDPEDRALAMILLKNNLISEEIFQGYVEFSRNRDSNGKVFLGAILLDLEAIVMDDINEYLLEQEKKHMDFCHVLVKRGFIHSERLDELKKMHDEDGTSVIQLVNDMNLMTRDSFINFYNNSCYTHKLGEWLLLKGKITQKDLEKARDIQKINRFYDYLIYHDHCKKEALDKVQEKMMSLI